MASTQPAMQIEPSANKLGSQWSSVLDILLFAVVTSAAIYVFALLSYSLFSQVHTYSNAINAALREPSRGDVVALAYARATDFAIVKTSVVFLGFIMAFLGALYVLRSATAAFNLSASASGASGSFQTSSPGLVMIALGVTTVILALYARTSVGLDSEVSAPGRVEVHSVGTPVPTPNPSPTPKTSAKRTAAPTTVPTGPAKAPSSFPPFPIGSAELTTTQKQYLTNLALAQVQSTGSIVITPQLVPAESTELSMALAERRGSAIKQFLQQYEWIANRISVTSWGKNVTDPNPGDKIIIVPPKKKG